MSSYHRQAVPAVRWACIVVLGLFPSACRSPQGKPAAAEGTGALFPPEGVDHLEMTVELQVEIFGIGKDTVKLAGSAVVHRSGPRGDGGREMIGDLVGASFRGKSEVFGDVVAVESPIQKSPCRYTASGEGRYVGEVEINGWFWLPRHDLLIYSDGPVVVRGEATQIPPLGQVAETVTETVSLHDFRKPQAPPVGSLTSARGSIAKEAVAVAEHMQRVDVTVGDLAPRPE